MRRDVLGRALRDYLVGKHDENLLLHIGHGAVEEMPVEEFFRRPEDFPELERIALTLCSGQVLDIGAGAGSHALYLQNRGMNVTALEQSPQACAVMRARGIRQVIQTDFLHYQGHHYDTLLFMMNGIGLAGNLDGLRKVLQHCRLLLNPGGQLLFDSSDVAYLYIDGSVEKPHGYYGVVRYQYAYKGARSVPFNWLFIDQATLTDIARSEGWVVQLLYEDGNDQYLVRMEPIG